MRRDRDHDREIAAMFDRVAPRYDVLNHVLSFGTDVAWRRRALAELAARPGDAVLDLGAGTGDLAIALRRGDARARVIAVDLSPRMLALARRRDASLPCLIATAHALPFADASIDRAISGFTVRNVADLARTFAELARVVRPGGRVVILELSHPPNAVIARVYRALFEHVTPRLAALLGGDPEAYRYLPRSLRTFPPAEPLARLLRDAGFTRVRFARLTFGIAAVHVAERA